jgi:hypothetical protein
MCERPLEVALGLFGRHADGAHVAHRVVGDGLVPDGEV